MEKILSKLSIYEFFSSFISGLCMVSYSYLMIIILEKKYISFFVDNNIIFVTALSYLLATVIHEFASILERKILNRKQRFIKISLLPKKSDDIHMDEEELQLLKQKIKINHNIDLNDDNYYTVYKLCKNNSSVTDSADKRNFHAVAIFSKNMSFYFLLNVITLIICLTIGRFDNLQRGLVCVFISSILCVILYIRYINFTKRKYINIFKQYIYSD